MKRPLSIAVRAPAILAVVLLAASCRDAAGPPVSISLSPGSASVYEGETLQFTATVQNASTSGAIYSVSPSNVATIDGNGMLRGLTPGVAQVTARAVADDTKTASATIEVLRQPVTTVSVSPGTGSLQQGETLQLQAVLRDRNGNSLSGRNVSWSSSNSGIASVSATGLVTARSAGGPVAITATSEGVSGGSQVTVRANTTVITVENWLIDAVAITVNGSSVGNVPAESTRQFTVPRVDVQVSWSLIRRTTSNGDPVGESISGVFSPAAAQDALTYEIDNVVGETTYFAPVVNNQTATRLLMGVNMGLSSENRCNCVVPGSANNIAFGYYRFFSNSNVHAYADGSGYSGNYIYWNNLSSYVSQLSGITRLNATSVNFDAVTAGEPLAGPSMEGRRTPGVISNDRPLERPGS